MESEKIKLIKQLLCSLSSILLLAKSNVPGEHHGVDYSKPIANQVDPDDLARVHLSLLEKAVRFIGYHPASKLSAVLEDFSNKTGTLAPIFSDDDEKLQFLPTDFLLSLIEYVAGGRSAVATVERAIDKNQVEELGYFYNQYLRQGPKNYPFLTSSLFMPKPKKFNNFVPSLPSLEKSELPLQLDQSKIDATVDKLSAAADAIKAVSGDGRSKLPPIFDED